MLPLGRGSRALHRLRAAPTARRLPGTQAGATAAVAAFCAGSAALRCDEIRAPESHRRAYRHVALANGLSALLASEPTCDKAAAALCVGVGRLHEPKELPGLAHFCEHMLFLGTERFPDEGEYKRFIKRHGGYCNASTSDDMTTFAFDVAPEHLVGALDRFSEFFVSPGFSASATDREIDAVDSEHSMRLNDDGRRSYATLLSDANPAHPLHWGSGNARTLRDEPRSRGIDVHAEVIKFHREHYSAGDMTLAVLSKEPLDVLQLLVEERFGRVRHSGRHALRGDDHGDDQPAIRSEDFRGLILREPVKDIRSLSFSWQLPWQVPLWRSKPTGYASHILGHEGPGSLLSLLKSRGWATSLSAGSSEYGCFSTFSVSVGLSEKGLDHIEDIGTLLFTCIGMIQRAPVEAWALDEMCTLREIDFRFRSDSKAYSLVQSLASSLQTYPAEHVLSGPALVPEPSASASFEVLRQLDPTRVRMQLTAKAVADRCSTTDPWYCGRFQKLPLEASWLASWSAALHGDSPCSELRLPGPNMFVPTDLASRSAEPTSAPQQLQGPDCGPSWRLFLHQDGVFGQPKAMHRFRIYSHAVSASVETHVMSHLWEACVAEQLQEYAYDAEIAGLGFSLSNCPGGFEITVGGFRDKLPVLLNALLTAVCKTEVDPGAFEIVRDRLHRGLQNIARKSQPINLAGRKSRELCFSTGFPPEAQLEALDSIRSPEVLQGMIQRLLAECHVEALLAGDVLPEEARALAKALSEGLSLEKSKAIRQLPERAELALPAGRTLWRVAGTNPEDPNNAVRCEIQLDGSVQNAAHAALLTRVLSPRFFERLRTQQQLGYIVSLSSSEGYGFVNIVGQVQSEYPADFVRGRIDDTLASFLVWIEDELDQEELDRQAAGLASNLAEAPKSQAEQFGRHWAEIARRRLDFGRRDSLRQAVLKTDLQGFREFARTVLGDGMPRLYVQVESLAPNPSKEAKDEAPPATPTREFTGDEAMLLRQGKWVALDGDVDATASRPTRGQKRERPETSDPPGHEA